jgi:hypothetical protein
MPILESWCLEEQQTMKFFTREWLTGELTDETYERVIPAYNRHLAEILPRLTPTLRIFAKTENLHDALIRGIVVGSAQRMLQLYLRCGDVQYGYYDLDIHYKGIQADEVVIDTLALVAQNAHSEVLFDELDALDDAFVHSLIFHPGSEVSIIFEDFAYERTPQKSRDFSNMTERFRSLP